jgi:hypothetical protein
MAKGHGLGLTLPPQAKPGKEPFDISPRPLAAWVSELAIANVGETTKALYRALHEVNRHTHGWKQRYHFLESIRTPLDAMQRVFSQRYDGLSFPLPAKTQQIVTLSQRLHLEMAIGYMAAIEGMLDSHFLFHDRHALKVMVHRASRHLNQSVLIAYQVYGQQQPGIWQQLHRLYAFAEAQDFHQDSIKDSLFTDLPESSIARVYKQIVMLATASPYRLRQGEVVALHKTLARWSAHAKLLQAHDHDASKALFALHLDSDNEPEYRSLDHLPCDSAACRLIDTHQLVSVVREEAGNNTLPAARLTPEFYKRLIQDWEYAPSRSERRNEGGDTIDVVIGMINIHQLIAPEKQSSITAPQPPGFTSTPTRDKAAPSRKSGDDLWNPYPANEKKAAANPITPTQASTPAATTIIMRWQIINESVGGFRLAVPEGQNAAIRVGEVLAVREVHSPERWHLTVVRWIRHLDEGAFEAGIQIIASEMAPVMVKNISPGKDKGEFQRALLLPEAPERNQPATVFTPNRLFNPAERVILLISGRETVIVLGNAIQDSGSFVQFEFHTDEKTGTPATGQAVGTGGSPFEMLWGQL